MAKAIRIKKKEAGVSVILRTEVGLVPFKLFKVESEWTGAFDESSHFMWKEDDIERKLFREDTANYLKCMEEAFRAADLDR